MKICDTKSCTGCSACMNVCPQSCITMTENTEGFIVPKIDKDKCIQCRLCVSSCPQNHPIDLQRNEKTLIFAAYSKNVKQMKNSTSGGIFPILAEAIIAGGGCVYGAEMSDDFQVSFARVEEKKDLMKLQGSKYVQSNINLIFRDVLKDLKSDRKVLFSGLPCQIGGLYSYLGKDFDNLYTIDVVCRGVPSGKLLKEYITYRESKENSELVNIIFRAKKKKWKPMSFGTFVHLKFKNGRQYDTHLTSEPYYMVFLKNIAMKESCYSCHYNGFPRVGDITLGDFAGLGVLYETDFYNKDGISQVLLNSDKGRLLYEDCKQLVVDEERTLDECCFFNLNLWSSSVPSRYREQFFETMKSSGIQKALEKYVLNYRSKLTQKIKDIIICILGEKQILLFMHKNRIRDRKYPPQWPANKYVNYRKMNNNEKSDT